MPGGKEPDIRPKRSSQADRGDGHRVDQLRAETQEEADEWTRAIRRATAWGGRSADDSAAAAAALLPAAAAGGEGDNDDELTFLVIKKNRRDKPQKRTIQVLAQSLRNSTRDLKTRKEISLALLQNVQERPASLGLTITWKGEKPYDLVFETAAERTRFARVVLERKNKLRKKKSTKKDTYISLDTLTIFKVSKINRRGVAQKRVVELRGNMLRNSSRDGKTRKEVCLDALLTVEESLKDTRTLTLAWADSDAEDGGKATGGEGGHRYEMQFESLEEREAFAKQVKRQLQTILLGDGQEAALPAKQQPGASYSDETAAALGLEGDSVKLSIACSTWNVGNTTPQRDLSAWLGMGGAHDVHVVAAQECTYNNKKSKKKKKKKKPRSSSSPGDEDACEEDSEDDGEEVSVERSKSDKQDWLNLISSHFKPPVSDEDYWLAGSMLPSQPGEH